MAWPPRTSRAQPPIYLRDSSGMSYVRIELNSIKDASKFKILPMSALMSPVADVTQVF